MSLTQTLIKNAKPAVQSYKMSDAKGLFLLVSPGGSKFWRYKYRFGGKEKLLSLGHYPEIGLAQARDLHAEARKLIRGGKDPAVEAERKKQALIAAANATFKRIAEDWLNDQKPLWSKANAFRVRSRIEKDLYPAFGSKPICEIDGPMVLRALRKIEARGSIETAKRVRGYIYAIFKRAKGEHLIARDALHDIDDIKDALKPTLPGAKQPALTSLPQLLELQKSVDRSTGGVITKLASRFLALTLVRVGVLRTALWEEFEGIDWDDPDQVCDAPIWRIPAERMKLAAENKGDAAFGHDVPLSVQAVETLRALRNVTGTSALLFPSATSWRQPMSDSALSSLYKRMAGGHYKGRMVPHGWRSAFSTIMNERAAELDRGGDRMIIDMILAHVPKGISSSEWAYNRARYRKPRAKRCQEWADLIMKGLASPHTLPQPDR